MVGMRLEYGRNMVGMRSEYGWNMVENDLEINIFFNLDSARNDSEKLGMAKNLSLNFFLFFTRNEVGIWLDSYHSARNLVRSTRIPTIPLGSARNVWGRVKYCSVG